MKQPVLGGVEFFEQEETHAAYQARRASGRAPNELVGIAGKMTINIVEGKHLYEFDYTFVAP